MVLTTVSSMAAWIGWLHCKPAVQKTGSQSRWILRWLEAIPSNRSNKNYLLVMPMKRGYAVTQATSLPKPAVFAAHLKLKEVFYGRQPSSTTNASDPRLDRVDDECHGAHRSRSFPLAHVLYPGDSGQYPAGYVGGNCPCPASMSCNRRLLCGDGETVPRNREFLLLRRAVVFESRKGLEVCPNFEVHRGLGIASLLLDLSRGDVRRDGRAVRVSGGYAVAELHERFASWPGVHGAGGRGDLFCGGLHRLPRRRRRDIGEHRDQRYPDQRPVDFLRHGAELSHESSSGKRCVELRFRFGRRLYL